MKPYKKLLFISTAITIIILLLITSIDSKNQITIYQLETNKINTSLTIALVSDFHNNQYNKQDERVQELAQEIFKEKPDLIISCGAAVAVPFFYIGKMMGAKVVYIEVFDRIDKPTMTGKMVYPIADKFVVQWDEQKKVYPKAVNLGSIF